MRLKRGVPRKEIPLNGSSRALVSPTNYVGLSLLRVERVASRVGVVSVGGVTESRYSAVGVL